MKYVFYAFLAYILFVFIFRLVIPVYRASRRFKKGVREMQERMAEQQRQQQQTWQGHTEAATPPSRHKAGEYIDFEDVD